MHDTRSFVRTKIAKKRKRNRAAEMEAGRVMVMERGNSSHCALQNAAASSNVKLANLMKLYARLELHWNTTNYWQGEREKEEAATKTMNGAKQ